MSFNNPLLAAPSRDFPKNIVVVGAGTIGPDIGYYIKSAIPGCAITLIDVSQAALDKAMSRFETYSKDAVKRGRIDSQRAKEIMSNVSCSVSYEGIGNADWVIEAATEDLAIKHEIFRTVEAAVSPTTLITSNTSSLPAARVFEFLTHKGRATVTHLFSPAVRNVVVEVVKAAQLDERVLSDLRWLLCATGKVPITTSDVTCFMLDRIFDNWCNEAALLLDDASAAQIDSVAREFVHAGPFFVLNLANGNPIIIEANGAQADAEGEHYRPAQILYSVKYWNVDALPDSALLPSAEAARIRDRLLGILFSQTFDVLDREIGEPADLELGCRLALGFKDGPLALMQRIGASQSERIENRLLLERPGMPRPTRPYGDYRNFKRHALVDKIDDVIVITIRRPEVDNLVTEEVLEEIGETLRRFQDQTNVHGFVVTGYGTNAFSAGYDQRRLSQVLGDREAALAYARRFSHLFQEIENCRRPVVAAINGVASGAGLELAFRCHARVALRDASFLARDVELWIVPPFGMLVTAATRWPDAVELLHQALCLALPIDAEQARIYKMVASLASGYSEMIAQAIDLCRGHLSDYPTTVSSALHSLKCPTRIENVPSPLSRSTVDLIESALRTASASESYEIAIASVHEAFAQSVLGQPAIQGINVALKDRKQK